MADEFLQVYKGIVTDYKGMVHQMSSGPCLVLEVRGCCGPETPRQFKELAGPSDPFHASKLYPGSLRAEFGKDIRRNVVHCTDVPEDARLEVEFFFKETEE
ncbi:nucleoside diphosphate kinase 7 [Ixodes scapularis]|uniref:nucleoside diphosphate kinase 7 n=1 Tax=Ixodes scapularis TaxID=6945 RepID=UPI001C385D34|nr:nucleoside diphosphate kinase 7 [Ixodes scapularis]